ncbi:hypothetical protein Y032_0273g991 [Ancylostoma ceylanicum]|uniref:Uncharacterized protein n=1 Tax=Ancylostoma ceylanicum TaxID=53326 RepID=A0A016S942_9BILA|nr:hypothetical protein Y032_0273g991 [Ancylostoma ceylanicum]
MSASLKAEAHLIFVSELSSEHLHALIPAIFLEQIYAQRSVLPLISAIGQAKTGSPDVAAVAGGAYSLERIPHLHQEAGTLTLPKAGFSSLL